LRIIDQHVRCSTGVKQVTFLLIALIVIFVCGAALALARGLLAFHQDAERLRNGDQQALEINGVQQNRMMAQRVLFQGVAIVLVAVLGALASTS
jgi:Na+-transporting NADH:ubiquinone oxidoreductase subunit NqrC